MHMNHIASDSKLNYIQSRFLRYKLLNCTAKNYQQPPMLFIVTLSKVLLFSLDVLSPCETMDDYKKAPVDVYISEGSPMVP